MNQTKVESLIENVINVGSGMIISMGVWAFIIMPVWGYEASFGDTFNIAVIFTVVSVVRGYYWRRFFNAGVHKTVHTIVKEYFSRGNFDGEAIPRKDEERGSNPRRGSKSGEQ